MFLLNIGLVPLDRFQSIFRLSAKKSEVWATCRKMVVQSLRFGYFCEKVRFLGHMPQNECRNDAFWLKIGPHSHALIKMHFSHLSVEKSVVCATCFRMIAQRMCFA